MSLGQVQESFPSAVLMCLRPRVDDERPKSEIATTVRIAGRNPCGGAWPGSRMTALQVAHISLDMQKKRKGRRAKRKKRFSLRPGRDMIGCRTTGSHVRCRFVSRHALPDLVRMTFHFPLIFLIFFSFEEFFCSPWSPVSPKALKPSDPEQKKQSSHL